MIPQTILKVIFRKIQTDLSLVFIREDQSGKVPPYPYASYKQIISTLEGVHQNIKEYSPGSVSTEVKLETNQKSFSVVSISILDKTMTDELHEKLNETLQWFQSNENIVAMQASGVTPRNRGIQIQDRSFFNDNFYVGRLGFDISFDYNSVWESQVEKIETIEIENTIDDIEQDNITFTGE